MRDAFSGIINIGMIVVFLVIVSGYLAYNVTYTKAFRVKNKIIDYIEKLKNGLEVYLYKTDKTKNFYITIKKTMQIFILF